MLQAIYDNPIATCFFLFFIFWGLESCIKAWRKKDED